MLVHKFESILLRVARFSKFFPGIKKLGAALHGLCMGLCTQDPECSRTRSSWLVADAYKFSCNIANNERVQTL